MAERTFTGTIISETDKNGKITLANDVFQEVAGYTEDELMGAPHNIVRHDDMPRAVFKLLWDTISTGKDIRAYVVNKAKNGDHYWVLAHVTATANGYRSERTVPDRKVLDDVIIPLYKQLRDKEKEMGFSDEGMEASFQMVLDLLKEKGVSYDELIDSLAG